MTELVATSRERLVRVLTEEQPITSAEHDRRVGVIAVRLADALIDSGVVRVVDPDDPELVGRVAEAIHEERTPPHTTVPPSYLGAARAAIGAVFPA